MAQEVTENRDKQEQDTTAPVSGIRVVKRNGDIVSFDGEKIAIAVKKAMAEEPPYEDDELAEEIARECEAYYSDRQQVGIEEIQDYVEVELMQHAPEVAKRYIIYRLKRAKLRANGWEMTDLQRDIYKSKYQYDEESFDDFLTRVAAGEEGIKKLIRDKKFMPAGRILAGRGLDKLGRKITLSNCYVMPQVEDNIESIFDTAKWMARTYSYGGGVGLTLSKLRPAGSKVQNAASTTTGAVSFMNLYSMTTGLIGMKGRRGALMLNLDVSHPDIEEFIDIKNDLTKVTFANISVNVDNAFMEAVEKDEDYLLHFDVEPTQEQIRRTVRARDLYQKLCYNNWNMAEPGILFKDRINGYNLMSADPDFHYAGVNPCAEEPLPAFGACNLSSINLGAFVLRPFTARAEMDWEGLKDCVRQGVIYLNGVLDENTNLHPLPQQRESSAKYRQIGLGIMGLADAFIKLDVRYGSPESLKLIDQMGSLIANTALQTSALLAKEDGPFPAYKQEAILNSDYFQTVATEETRALVEEYGLRNSQLLTIAPTGSISTLIGCSNGVEPIFQISYTRKTESINGGVDTYYKVVTPIIEEYMHAHGLHEESELPSTIITTSNLNYKERIEVQATWQKYIDASISSTINLPEEATVKEVEELYLYAWKKGLKGVTVYRDNCARAGILITDKKKKTAQERIQDLQSEMNEIINHELEKDPGTCPICGGKMMKSGGCEECQDCGYSPCAI